MTFLDAFPWILMASLLVASECRQRVSRGPARNAPRSLSGAEAVRLRAIVERGELLEAIRECRQLTGAGLQDGRDMVVALRSK